MLAWLGSLFGSHRPRRTPEQQQAIAQACAGLALYTMSGCPYCLRVQIKLRRLGLPIEQRNVSLEPEHRAALSSGGGRLQAPCLRIEGDDGKVSWLYESADITRYLQQHFG